MDVGNFFFFYHEYDNLFELFNLTSKKLYVFVSTVTMIHSLNATVGIVFDFIVV